MRSNHTLLIILRPVNLQNADICNTRKQIEGSGPEWYISTIYRGFPTRMVYLNYISKVSNQNGIPQLYIEGFQPEWYISTMISRVFDQNGVSLLYIMLEIHHSGREPSIYSRDVPFWSETVELSLQRYTILVGNRNDGCCSCFFLWIIWVCCCRRWIHTS